MEEIDFAAEIDDVFDTASGDDVSDVELEEQLGDGGDVEMNESVDSNQPSTSVSQPQRQTQLVKAIEHNLTLSLLIDGQLFTVIQADSNKGKCQLCKKSYTYSEANNASNLTKHLVRLLFYY